MQLALSTRNPLFLIGLIFLLSRVLYFLAGVCMELEPLQYYNQFIDPLLLKNDLWRSLFYLKEQPPLFNLFLGIGLKLFPQSAGLFYQVTFWAIALASSLCLFSLMERRGVS